MVPNLDALNFFCESILPHLRAAGAEIPIHWVGNASSEEQRRYADQFSVQLTGYVDDVRPFMRDTLCNIVPLRAGGGTRLKILNSWAMGKAIVSTSVGCEGLDARDGENILIRDDPREFAEAILSLRSDEPLRLKLEKGARKTAEEHYCWDVIGPSMVASYRDLLPGHLQRGRHPLDLDGLAPDGCRDRHSPRDLHAEEEVGRLRGLGLVLGA